MKDKIIIGLIAIIIVLTLMVVFENIKESKVIINYENLMIEKIENIEGLNHWSIRRYGGNYNFGSTHYYVDVDIERRDTEIEFSRDFDSINDINSNIQSILNEINKLK